MALQGDVASTGSGQFDSDRTAARGSTPPATPEGSSPPRASLLPSLELPRGGGAIRGIGEKFSTNASTGTNSLNVPIAVSPGRATLPLALSLSYDSAYGNGVFGLGWRLSVPAITRKTDRGLPRYFDDEDIFVLAGVEDLVPVGATDLVQAGGMSFRRQRYRPRVEAAFVRIERWTSADGDTHWRSWSTENVLSIYGRTAGARVMAAVSPGQPARVFSWLLEETHDDRGNVAHYIYVPEDARGIDRSRVSEANRFDAAGELLDATQRYLKRVRYGNQDPLTDREAPVPVDPAAFHFELVLDYGDHDGPAPTPEPDRTWPGRQDPFSTYRAAFEVRTYRLCRRLLMFHRFAELGSAPCLIRSTDLDYREGPLASYLISIAHAGYQRSGTPPTYTRAALPPLELSYIEPAISDQVSILDHGSLEGITRGLDGNSQWLDLDGEGIPGLLLRTDSAWFYKANLGEGRLRPPHRQPTHPVPAEIGGAATQFSDLGGDGNLDLVRYGTPLAGYAERNHDGGWAPFVALPAVPRIDWQDSNLRFVDLDGDGLADVLITERDTLVWYRSLAKDGFEPPRWTRKPNDERDGPVVVFADGTETIQLADMSGDGLVDIVRIRNGEVCYWPNLGHGLFGRKITLDNSPRLDDPDQFAAARVRLADVDGSGTNDLLYLGRDGIRIYFNQSGNAFSDARRIASLPPVDSSSSVAITDLLGQGTPCIVWSSPTSRANPVLYVDLMGGRKPHLLEKVVNNLGAETAIQYASSTKFYLNDQRDGRPWLTRLSFPVHVVERIEHRDLVSRSKLVTRFAYHHGYFDGQEREFRGFARVEQWDAESFTDSAAEIDLPPVRTVTWFHTGAWLERERLERELAREYYGGAWIDGPLPPAHDYFGRDTTEQDPKACALFRPDTAFESSSDPWSVADLQEATRALRGRILRQEVYAEDGGPAANHPYSVSQRSFAVRRIAAASPPAHGVFFAHPRETLNIHYERGAASSAGWSNRDPRIDHQLVLSVDELGNVTAAANLAYPRRDVPPGLAEQAVLWATLIESSFANRPGESDWYRAGVTVETTRSELTALPAPAGEAFTFDELAAAIARPATRKRIVDARRQLYCRDYATAADHEADAAGPLPLGQITARAIPHQVYRRVLDKDLIDTVYGTTFDRAILGAEACYVELEPDVWWSPSGRVVPDPAAFFLPVVALDAWHSAASPARSTLAYDRYRLLPIDAVDAAGNRVVTGTRTRDGGVSYDGNDYRVLSPSQVCDANRNRVRVAFDVLGRVAKVWRLGRFEDPGAGDDEAHPGVELRYDFDAWKSGSPAWVHVATREAHRAGGDAFLPGGAPNRIGFQHVRTYSDGFGREVMRKVGAEPGPAPRINADGNVVRNPDGTPVTDDAPDRWIGSGRTVFDNKGNPVKKYEPFFSMTPDFESASALAIWGVTPIFRFDPLGRLVQTNHPNGTSSRVVFAAWSTEKWDENDTSADSAWFRRWSQAPQSPAGIQSFLALIDPPWTTSPTDLERASWLCAILALPPPTSADLAWLLTPSGAPPAIWQDVVARASDRKRAAGLAVRHAGTQAVTQFDALGRGFLAIADRGSDVLPAEQKQLTRLTLDVLGNQLAITDARGNQTLRQTFDGLQRAIFADSADAGATRTLFDATGQPVRSWDPRNLALRHRYDALRRPIGTWAQAAGAAEQQLLRMVYGEGSPDDEARGRRTRLYKVYDGAGLVTHEVFDLQGNLVALSRRLAKEFRSAPDWPDDETAAGALLETESWASAQGFDAIGRLVSRTAPDGRVVALAYDQSGLLSSITVTPTGGAAIRYVSAIDYDARGQRTRMAFGSGMTTTRAYDAESFRLVNQRTTSASRTLQDNTYAHDPVGNLTSIRDAVSYANPSVAADGLYEYDAIYQLMEAEGREMPGAQPSELAPPVHPNDMQALRRYRESYDYDPAGNLRSMTHELLNPQGQRWKRSYAYEAAGNRLTATSAPGDPPGTLSARYTHDAAGNLATMPHLSNMDWDPLNRLIHARRQNGGGPNDVYFAYDAAGKRIRKVYEHGGTIERRLYLDGWELFRSSSAGSGEIHEERTTLHVEDRRSCIALVDVETVDTSGAGPTPTTIDRYQLADHLGSYVMETDPSGAVIAYEEFHPYGTSAFSAPGNALDISPRQYGYNGKEHDEETSFYYYGARHYVAWLGRWTTPDPKLFGDSMCSYSYVANNPVRFRDHAGNAKATAVPEQQALLDALGEKMRRIQESVDKGGFGNGTNAGNIRDVAMKEHIAQADPNAFFDDIDLPGKSGTNTDVRFGDARMKVEFKGELFDINSEQIQNSLKDARRNKYTYAVMTKDGQATVLHTGEAPTAAGAAKLRTTAERIATQADKSASDVFQRTRGAKLALAFEKGTAVGKTVLKGVGSVGVQVAKTVIAGRYMDRAREREAILSASGPLTGEQIRKVEEWGYDIKGFSGGKVEWQQSTLGKLYQVAADAVMGTIEYFGNMLDPEYLMAHPELSDPSHVSPVL